MEQFFDIGLKVLLSAFILYIGFNATFRYHTVMNRVNLIFLVLYILIMISYLGTIKYFEFFLLSIMLFVVFIIFRLYFSKRRIYGFFIFNVWKNDYKDLSLFLDEQFNTLLLEKKHLCFSIKKPFLIVIRGVDSKIVKKTVKDFDHYLQKKPKSFTVSSYIHFAIMLILLISLWRF